MREATERMRELVALAPGEHLPQSLRVRTTTRSTFKKKSFSALVLFDWMLLMLTTTIVLSAGETFEYINFRS